MIKRIKPKPGQESVWDYPRPPRLEPVSKTLRVEYRQKVVGETSRGFRVLETSHPPVFYFPPEDVDTALLRRRAGQGTSCEFKGAATYWDLVVGASVSPAAAWSYLSPRPAFQPITGFLAFYPSRVDACFVDDERVQAQEGDFYGGWITKDIVGPFKGGPGTWGW